MSALKNILFKLKSDKKSLDSKASFEILSQIQFNGINILVFNSECAHFSIASSFLIKNFQTKNNFPGSASSSPSSTAGDVCTIFTNKTNPSEINNLFYENYKSSEGLIIPEMIICQNLSSSSFKRKKTSCSKNKYSNNNDKNFIFKNKAFSLGLIEPSLLSLSITKKKVLNIPKDIDLAIDALAVCESVIFLCKGDIDQYPKIVSNEIIKYKKLGECFIDPSLSTAENISKKLTTRFEIIQIFIK